jgi:hypothetical protein
MCLIKNNIESNNDISVGGNILNEIKPSTEQKNLPTKITGSQAPRWREGEVSIKQFHTFSCSASASCVHTISKCWIIFSNHFLR